MLKAPWKIPVFLVGAALLLAGVWLVTLGGRKADSSPSSSPESQDAPAMARTESVASRRLSALPFMPASIAERLAADPPSEYPRGKGTSLLPGGASPLIPPLPPLPPLPSPFLCPLISGALPRARSLAASLPRLFASPPLPYLGIRPRIHKQFPSQVGRCCLQRNMRIGGCHSRPLRQMRSIPPVPRRRRINASEITSRLLLPECARALRCDGASRELPGDAQ